MTKRQKRLEKIRQNIRNVSLEEFESIIGEFGYIEEGGKHPKAVLGDYTLPYKRKNPVRVCYVHELLLIIDDLK